MGTHGKSAASALVRTLKDSNTGVRTMAVWALGSIGEKSSIEPMIEALKDDNEDFRSVVSGALTQLTGQKFTGLEEWKKWWDENREK